MGGFDSYILEKGRVTYYAASGQSVVLEHDPDDIQDLPAPWKGIYREV